jgi:nitrate reductase NapE component
MAIKKCKECGKGVSTKATACPNCGARLTSGFSILRVLLLVLSIVVLLPVALISGGIIGFIVWLVWIIILLLAK